MTAPSPPLSAMDLAGTMRVSAFSASSAAIWAAAMYAFTGAGRVGFKTEPSANFVSTTRASPSLLGKAGSITHTMA